MSGFFASGCGFIVSCLLGALNPEMGISSILAPGDIYAQKETLAGILNCLPQLLKLGHLE